MRREARRERAWLIGSGAVLTFAALVVSSSGNGRPVCGPIVARFLTGL